MRWRMLALLFAARIGLGLSFQTTASTGDSLSAAFGLGYAEIGTLIGLFMAPGLFLAMPTGFLGRVASDRVLVGGGLAVLGLGGLLGAVAGSEQALAMGRLVSGVGALFGTLYFTKMVADWFDGREMATAMSILVMSWPLGIAIGQVGHTWLAAGYGWHLPYLISGLYCLCAAAALVVYYRPPHDLPPPRTRLATGLLAHEWGRLICAGIAWGTFNAGYIVYLSFGPAMLNLQGLDVVSAAAVISVGSWLMIGSGTVCGRIADRAVSTDRILVVTMAAAIAALLLLTIPGAELWASLLFGLIGMAPAGVIIALAGQAVAPERRAFGMGIFLTIYYAIISAAPVVAGWIVDRTGSPTGAIVLGIGLFALVVPSALIFSRIRPIPATLPSQEAA